MSSCEPESYDLILLDKTLSKLFTGLHEIKLFFNLCLFNTAGNRHKQNRWFCKEIREDNFRFWWRRVHEDASQGM